MIRVLLLRPVELVLGGAKPCEVAMRVRARGISLRWASVRARLTAAPLSASSYDNVGLQDHNQVLQADVTPEPE